MDRTATFICPLSWATRRVRYAGAQPRVGEKRAAQSPCGGMWRRRACWKLIIRLGGGIISASSPSSSTIIADIHQTVHAIVTGVRLSHRGDNYDVSLLFVMQGASIIISQKQSQSNSRKSITTHAWHQHHPSSCLPFCCRPIPYHPAGRSPPCRATIISDQISCTRGVRF